MTRPPRLSASLTSEEGIQSINELIRTIDATPALSVSDFGKDVRIDLESVKTKLEGGAFFSLVMQNAIEGWGRGIAKWVRSPDTVQ